MKSPANSKPKILVVDDADNLDKLYCTLRQDYKVLRAVSEQDALNIMASEGDVAVLLSNQYIPLISRAEFLSLTATKYLDIMQIILTSSPSVELVEAINTGKVFKYLTKPWNPKELKAVVRQALDTHILLKVRIQKLYRTLHRESLLNTVINTIRSAPDYRQSLQTIVDTVGQMLEVSCCILRPCQDDLIVESTIRSS